MIREFLHVFYGNELVVGVLLANWLFLTATGAILGRFSPKLANPYRFITIALVLTGLLPIIMVFILYALKHQVFIPGSLAGLFDIFLSSLILLAPFCLLSGYAFTFFAHTISQQKKKNQISRVYGFESLGALAGGACFSLILIHVFNVYQILAMILVLNILAATVIRERVFFRIQSLFLWIPALFVLVFSFIFPVDRMAAQFLYRNQQILETRDTPYGPLVVTQSGDQVNIYENQTLLASSLNTIANEEDVHYAMIQHPDPRKVLLISGSITGMIDEVLKYPVERIDVVEMNPVITSIGESYAGIGQSEKVHVIHQDARHYIDQSDARYDVVLMHMPPPSTAQINRYYTTEFFNDVSEILSPLGILGFGLPYSQNYPGTLTRNLLSQIYSTIEPIFEEVVFVPGEKIYFICGPAGQAGLNITERLETRSIDNDYVSPYYLDDDLIRNRAKTLKDGLVADLKPNTDFHPRAFFWEIRRWLSYFKWDTRILVWLMALALLGLMIRMRHVTAGMFAAGFAGTGMEFLIIFMFQVIYGYMYFMIGIIITAVMAGIAAGALIPGGIFARVRSQTFMVLLFWVALGSFLTPVLFFALIHIPGFPGWLGQIILIGWSLCFSFFIGRVFFQASHLQAGLEAHISATIYSMDLFGAAFGAMLVSSLLLPLAGIWQTSMILGIMNILAAGFYRFKSVPQLDYSN
jgi:spermidine synthase